MTTMESTKRNCWEGSLNELLDDKSDAIVEGWETSQKEISAVRVLARTIMCETVSCHGLT